MAPQSRGGPKRQPAHSFSFPAGPSTEPFPPAQEPQKQPSSPQQQKKGSTYPPAPTMGHSTASLAVEGARHAMVLKKQQELQAQELRSQQRVIPPLQQQRQPMQTSPKAARKFSASVPFTPLEPVISPEELRVVKSVERDAPAARSVPNPRDNQSTHTTSTDTSSSLPYGLDNFSNSSQSSSVSSDSDFDDDGTTTLSESTPRLPTTKSHTSLPARSSLYSYTSRSQSSLSAASSHFPSFAPPFYNRPPTPLPPSPSLTSLLRPLPTFSTPSAFTSRPTTPDSSDTEAGATVSGGASTAAAVARSARRATTVPRASPKVPTYEYYGFVLYLGSSAAFLMYLLWSYLPTPFLHRLGIYYYPDRWWSLAVPGWLVMALCWVYVALAGYNTGNLTLGLGSLECVVDEKGMVAVVDAEGRIVREARGKEKVKGAVGKGKDKGAVQIGAGYGRLGIGVTATVASTGRAKRDKEAQQQQRVQGDLEWKNLWNYGTDAVMDIPIGGVCEILYGAGREAGYGGDDDDDDYAEELGEDVF